MRHLPSPNLLAKTHSYGSYALLVLHCRRSNASGNDKKRGCPPYMHPATPIYTHTYIVRTHALALVPMTPPPHDNRDITTSPNL